MEDTEHLHNGCHIEDITTADISNALENRIGATNFVIIRTSLKPLKKIGLLGEHSILTVTYLNEEGNEASLRFFVKFFPQGENQAEFADGIGAFKKEMFIYNLLDKLKNNENDLISSITPKCYFSRYNQYLIMDNVTDEGFETINKRQTLDYDTVLILLQSLARFHAASIIYEESTLKKSLLELYEDELEESFFNDRENFANAIGIKASVIGIIKEIDILNFKPKLKTGKDFETVAEEVCYKIYDLVKPSKRFRNVLSHGDIWATNFLVKRDSRTNAVIGCKFVDFQCGRYVPPSQDVLSLLYLNTTRAFREKYMYQLAGMYYSYLEKHLKFVGLDANELLPFTEFLDSCEEQKVFAVVQSAIYFPLILIDEDLVQKYFSDEVLYLKAFTEDRSHLVLAHIDSDDLYKERLTESIQDLKECCECL